MTLLLSKQKVFQTSTGKTLSFLVLKNQNYLFLPLLLTTGSLSKQTKKEKKLNLSVSKTSGAAQNRIKYLMNFYSRW